MFDTLDSTRDPDDTAIVYDMDNLFVERTLQDQLAARIPNVDSPYSNELGDVYLSDDACIKGVRPRAEFQRYSANLKGVLVGMLLRTISGFEHACGTRFGFGRNALTLPICRAPLELETRVARFIAPIEFEWTPESAEIADLVREYTETVYADH